MKSLLLTLFLICGTAYGVTQIQTGNIANNAVTNAKAAQMSAHTIKGNNTGSSADPDDLTLSEVATELDGYFVDSVGTIDSQAKEANGAAVTAGGALILQNADFSFPGLASTGTQDFAGVKRFAATPLMKDGVDIEDPGSGTESISLAAPTLASTFSVVLPATKCNPAQVWAKSASGDGYECSTPSSGGGGSSSYSGYQNGISGGCTTTSTSLSDPSACTNIALNAIDSNGITCSQTGAGTDLPGIDCTLPATGRYLVRSIVQFEEASADIIFYARLVNASATAISYVNAATPGNVYNNQITTEAIYNAPSTSETFLLKTAVSGGSASIRVPGLAGGAAITWTVIQL